MPLSYPLIRPSTPGVQKIKLSPNTQVAFSQSPFTGSEQSFEWPAEWFEAEVTMPPMSRASAESWNAMLAALRGRSGCFLLGDTAAKTPQGSAARSNVNAAPWSEDFTNSFWGPSGLNPTVADATTAPDGNTTADRLVENSATSTHFFRGIVSGLPVGAAYVYSIYVKSSGTRNFAYVGLNDNVATNFSYGTVNLTTGSVAVSQGTVTAVNVGNGWWRVSMLGTVPATGVFGLDVGGASAAGVISYLGDGVSGIYMWGAQLEPGSTASAYIGTSFTFNGKPQISMNGTTQGPKFILLKGLAPNSVPFKAGDYVECGYGLNATRITTSGGSTIFKDTFAGGPTSVSGQIYVDSVRVRNIGTKTVFVQGNGESSAVSVAPGVELAASFPCLGDGSLGVNLFFSSASSSDSLDFVAWAPRIQRQGIDENIIPSANQNFVGWAGGTGATVNLVQGYNRRLYKVLSDATSDAKGNCAVEIFPRWRNGDAVADGDPVNVFTAQGMFRLKDNLRSWEVDEALIYGLSFSCVEYL